MSRNYEVVISGDTNYRGFHYKEDAISHAKEMVGAGKASYVRCIRTGVNTFMLPKSQTKCTRCGNELEGKQHCLLCKSRHHYL